MHPHNYMDEARDLADHYGEPKKQADGTWWFLDKQGFLAVEVEDEGDINRLETALLQESLQSLREARRSINQLEEVLFKQKEFIARREDEILNLLYAIK